MKQRYIQNMSILILPISGMVAGIASILALINVAWKHGVSFFQGPASSSKEYTPILFVAAAALALLYVFYCFQGYTTFCEQNRMKKENSKAEFESHPSVFRQQHGKSSKAILAADRCAGNLLEQMTPFLGSIFAYATFVSSGDAAKIGWIWIFFRSYYPYAYNRYPFLFASTIPAYCCVWFMLGKSVFEAASSTA